MDVDTNCDFMDVDTNCDFMDVDTNCDFMFFFTFVGCIFWVLWVYLGTGQLTFGHVYINLDCLGVCLFVSNKLQNG